MMKRIMKQTLCEGSLRELHVRIVQSLKVKELAGQLGSGIDSENPNWPNCKPFGFQINSDEGKLIAGCNGFILFGAVHTDQLWVHPLYRKQGLATQLMNQVHTYGLQKECVMATVNTMSFQNALNFYLKFGYQIEFERQGHTNNSTCYFLKKEL